jgi:acylphosphatase
VAKRFRARVRGRVQGVGFRAYSAREARRLGVDGWVRNEFDGDVTVVAEGEDSAVEAFLDWLHHGPPGARVVSVDADWSAPAGDLAGFEIR